MCQTFNVRWLRAVTAACSMLLATVGAAAADPQPAVSFTSFSAWNVGSYSVGWSFTVNQPTEVSSLGYFDHLNDGLAGVHEVGIWTSGGVLVTSAVVPGGTSAPIVNGFRYVSIPVTILAPGSYVIGGQSNASDMFWASVSGFQASPLITFGAAFYIESTTLTRPTIPGPGVGFAYFGPGMLISAAPLDTPPSASAGVDFSVDEGHPVVLDGSGSQDVNGDSLSYSWIQLPGGTPVFLSDAATAHPTFAAPYVAVGGETLSFQLTVTANGVSAIDTVSVTIVNVNHTPVAVAGNDQSVAEGSPVTLHGEASFDSDGDESQPTFSYTWVQVAGAPLVTLTDPHTKNPSFTAPYVVSGGAPGVVATLIFELRVDDGLPPDAPAPGFAFTDVVDLVTIEITNVNNLPTAVAGADQTVDESTVVTLNASGSTDPDSDPLSHVWTQVGGPAATLVGGGTAAPTFAAPFIGPGGADLTFEVIVGDGYGGFAADTVVVHVQNVNDPPLASAARPTVATLWPPNHAFVSVGITGVSDPNNNATITITGVTQDEPTNGLGDGDTAIDAVINSDGTVLLRAERAGNGDGRVYRVTFTASDPEGSVSGVVVVTVPHSPKKPAIDNGHVFDSTR
jgi:hypothetical protein